MYQRQIPNALSAFRLVVALPAAYFIVEQLWLWASLLVLLAMASDVADGYFARRWRISSAFGGLLDHSCDAFFVFSCLLAMAFQHSVPLLLPVLVALSFIQYVFDSNALAGSELRSSILGRNNGIAYYGLVAVAVVTSMFISAPLLATSIDIVAWLLIASTLISMGERLYTLINLPAPV